MMVVVTGPCVSLAIWTYISMDQSISSLLIIAILAVIGERLHLWSTERFEKWHTKSQQAHALLLKSTLGNLCTLMLPVYAPYFVPEMIIKDP